MVNASLGNNFIPKIQPQTTYRVLSRLSADSLCNLCLLWTTIPQTSPVPSKEQAGIGISQDMLIKELKEYANRFKQKTNKNKKRLIDKIVVDYYPNGLNLLQFAQIDSQIIIEKPTFFYWQSSKIRSRDDQEQVINLKEPQRFLELLLAELSNFYLNHIYISRHPHYPLIIIRIQLFDLITDAQVSEVRKLNTSNSIVSRKPIFIAIPVNSSNIIHSYNQSHDTSTDIVLQSMEFALSTILDKQIKIFTSPQDQPIRSLESLHILKGNSRFTESLGVWAPYADGSIDISPFDDVNCHQTFKPLVDKVTEDERRRRMARLRFKGTLDEIKSSKLYEDVNDRKRKRDDEDRNVDKNEYSSIAPIQSISFEVKNEYQNFKPKVTLSFTGNDIFGGLHELCDRGIVDPEAIPGWLTGEETNSGVIEDGGYSLKVVTSSLLV